MPDTTATPLHKERPLWPLAILLAAFLIGWLASLILADEYLGNFSWAILATLGVMGAYWVIGIWTFVVPIRKAEKQGTAVKADKEAYRFADSLYLLGFLFTLSSFATASHFIVADKRMCDPFAKMSAETKSRLPEAERKRIVDDHLTSLTLEQKAKCDEKNLITDKLVQNSVALITTIIGLILRILMLRLLPGKQEDMEECCKSIQEMLKGLSNPAAAVRDFEITVVKLKETAASMAKNGEDMSATLQRVTQEHNATSQHFLDNVLWLQNKVAYDFTNGADAIHRRLAALVQQIERLSSEAQDRIRQASMDQRQIHMETMDQCRQQEFELRKMTRDWLDSCLKVLNDSFTTLTEEIKNAGAPFNDQIRAMLAKIHEELSDYAKKLNEGQIAVDQDRQQRMDAFAKAIEKRLCDLVKNLDAEGMKGVDGITRLVDNLIVQIAVRIGKALQELEEARQKLHEQQMKQAALAQDGNRP
ncbi:MAG: hypothetical protein OEL53_14310 [Rhodospirillales bacterium]|nr:hypothetical protein [Rhodospirillales bacterium]